MQMRLTSTIVYFSAACLYKETSFVISAAFARIGRAPAISFPAACLWSTAWCDSCATLQKLIISVVHIRRQSNMAPLITVLK